MSDIITLSEFQSKVNEGYYKVISRVYVASPLAASTEEGIIANMLSARDKCKTLNGLYMSRGIKFWAPHAYLPEFLNDNIPAERELGLSFGLKMLEMSEAVLVCGNRISSGMRGEIIKAAKYGTIIICEEDGMIAELNAILDTVSKAVGDA